MNTEELLPKLKEIMLRLSLCIDGLTWDRYVPADNQYIVYGWIYTDGKQRDFLIMAVHEEDVWSTTSSALWSREIAKVIYGQSDDHIDCVYVSELYKEFEQTIK